MARYGPDDVTVNWNSTSLPDVTVIGDIMTEALLEEITPFGSSYQTHAGVGVQRWSELTLEAPYADDANQLQEETEDQVGIGASATLTLTFGGSNTISATCLVKSVTRVLERNALTKFRAVLQPTGTITLGP